MLPRLHWGEIGEITPSKILFGARNGGNCLRSVCFLRLKRMAKGLFFQFIKCQWSFIFDLITAKGNPSQVVFKLLPTSEIQVGKKSQSCDKSFAQVESLSSDLSRIFIFHKTQAVFILGGLSTTSKNNLWRIEYMANKKNWMNEWMKRITWSAGACRGVTLLLCYYSLLPSVAVITAADVIV